MLIDVSTMKASTLYDLVTVGHFAIDSISSPKIKPARQALGGPPAYVSVAATRLDAKVSVISTVGDDFPEEYVSWLRRNSVDLSGLRQVATGSTTRFALRYQDKWKRRLQLQARAPSITTADIPHGLQAQAVHVGPIANEVPSDVVTKLRKLTRILALDPQGFLRDFDAHGNARLKPWREKTILELVDVYKSSQSEMKIVAETTDIKQAARKIADYGVTAVIATRGLQGSSLLFQNALYNVPACKPKVILDPTGAGDAYIGAFLAEYIRGKDPEWCACVGSAAASFIVEGIGPERFGNKGEVYARAREIYLKGI